MITIRTRLLPIASSWCPDASTVDPDALDPARSGRR